MLTPFLLKYAPSLSAWAVARHVIKKISGRTKPAEGWGPAHKRQGQVIIIGFGLNGRNLARVLRETDIPYAVLEMNSDTVREMKKKGEPVYYGDGTSKEMLHKLGIGTARLLVIAISDAASTRGIVSIARHENPGIYIIVRTRYLAEVDELKTLGADEVIPEEFETSIEIFSRALRKYNFPNNIILEMIDRIRSGGYAALRKVELQGRCLFEECDLLPEIEMDGYRTSEGSHLIGKSIAELQIRKKTGATIIAVRKGPDVITNPSPDFRFSKGDIILFTGDRKSMDEAINYFKGKGKEVESGEAGKRERDMD
jgi:CPA2 family monovalent cation:H+ antiporter-2